MIDTISEVQEVKNPNYIDISWEVIDNGINQIFNNIKKRNITYDYIYAIPRGGLVLGTMLSYRLNVPLLTTPEQLININGSVLFVDDILDSGNTMSKHLKINDNLNSNVCAFIEKSVTSSVIADFTYIIPNFALSLEEYNRLWYRFPWEVKNN